MLEIAGIVIGIIAAAFVMIFGGRGLIDIVHDRKERKRQQVGNESQHVASSEATTRPTDSNVSAALLRESSPPLQPGTGLGLERAEATTTERYPLVGRDRELLFLNERLEVMLQGEGSLVFITGQGGIGKTRLIRELRGSARAKGCQWLEGRLEKAGSQPYKAWTEIVRRCLAEQGASIESLAGPYQRVLGKIVPEISAELETSEPKASDPESERFRLFEGLTQFVIQASHQSALVLFLDDLQWAPSIELLHHLARNIGNQRVLMLVAYRDDELKEKSNLWQTVLAMNRERLFYPLRLEPLRQGDVARLLSHRVEGIMDPQLAEVLYHKTEGNPFFVEELLRLLQERKALVKSGEGWRLSDPDALEVPESVKAVVTEHMERLGTQAQGVLQMASVIGREFSLATLRELVGQGEETLVDVMDQCVQSGLLSAQRVPGQEVYSFTHDLIQEALYESIGPARRRRHHLRAGQALEKLYRGRLERESEALAYHFFEGNELENAVHYGELAAKDALRVHSYEKAAQLMKQSLEALKHLPETRQSIERAIATRIDLGSVLMTMRGYRAPEVEQIYTEARDLCERLGDNPQLFPVLWGLSRVYQRRGALQDAREIAEQLLKTAEKLNDASLLLEAHHTLWTVLFHIGEIRSAKIHTEQGMKLYNPDTHSRLAHQYGGHDAGVCCGNHQARILWSLGYPDRAQRRSKETLELAETLKHPFSLALALYWATWVSRQRGDLEVCQKQVAMCLKLATEHRFPRFVANGTLLQGWLLVMTGQTEDGMSRLREGFNELRKIGSVGESLDASALLVEAYAKEGDIEAGLEEANEALRRVHKSGESYYRYYEGILQRIKGDLLGARSAPEEASAEDCLQMALDFAREEQAKSLELRAALSLGRLWQRQGKIEEARKLVGEVYGWFTEGFDTPDLKAARALLEELS